jgi:hypothetical protein
MTDENKPAVVTRGELYPILGVVYLLIAFALLGGIQEEQSVLRRIGTLVLFGVAMVSSFTFSVLGIRERQRQAREKNNPPGQ